MANEWSGIRGVGKYYGKQNNGGNTDGKEFNFNDDGIVYTEYDNETDGDLLVNTNRIARMGIQDSDYDEGDRSGADNDDEDYNKNREFLLFQRRARC